MRPGQLERNDFELAIPANAWRVRAIDPPVHQRASRIEPNSRAPRSQMRCCRLFPRAAELEVRDQDAGVPSGMMAVLFCNGGKPDLLEGLHFGDELWDGEYDSFAIERTP